MNRKSTTKSPLNIVLQGMGAAGRARERAVLESPHWALAAKISRRRDEATSGLSQALADPTIPAWAISLENTGHAPAVRQALLAGKHVLCDYPLALSAKEGHELYALAQQHNLILHVEHIGLLSAEHKSLKLRAKAMGPLEKGEYLFQGGWKESMADPARMGPLPFLAISRLMQVSDLFGPLSMDSARLDTTGPGFSLHLHLRTASGAPLGFTEERRPGLPRRRSLAAVGTQGSLQWKAGMSGGDLFKKDLDFFYERIVSGRPCYYDEGLMLEWLGRLADIS